MKIKMKTTMAGPDGIATVGSVVELSDDQAKDLIAGGYAVSMEPATLPPTLLLPEKPVDPPKPVKPVIAKGTKTK